MRRLFLWLFPCLAILTASGCAQCPPSAQPPNVGDLKTTVRSYESSGAYARDIARVDAAAADFILRRAPQVKNPAIVLDIDETSLSNWPEIAVNDFAKITKGPCTLPAGPCGVTAWENEAADDAIPPTLALYKAAVAHDITVFFITGRDESVRAATARNLRRVGYTKWQALILRPAGTTTPSAADYKAQQRARIEAMGYTIVANIGDQPSDLAGGHSLRAFLLPDPFYRIP